ncbi:glycosyltransferase [Sulfuriferula multivorans]|uniref:Glycosyltransferase n=1 Tax=Sulfuriferula multivorans TaxID=1559896 RepID=A0A401JBR1_9PROT|nr:glycosyltransferase [Sulfuriferula multivorans]GBL45102.1 glycosyltransferase [Sulfuriferula multivorans]
MKVLHVLNELRPSGAEIMLRIAAPLFRENGVECELLATGETVGPYAPVLEAAGYRIHHIPFARSPAFFMAVARFAKRSGFDLVHMHSERGFIGYVLAARMAGLRRLVRTVHNNFNFGGWLRMRRGFERRLAERLGVRFIAIAPGVEQTERRLYGTSPLLIPNWFDSAHFHPVTPEERAAARAAFGVRPDEYALVSVGNCSVVKNHTALIEALARCTEFPWRYLHIGLEEPGAPERVLAERLGIADRIRFIGAVDDVRPVLHAAELYVMPSQFEGLGIATLEAFAVGLPALLTEVPGLVDFRQYLEDVSYCEPSAGGIAAVLRHLLQKGAGLDGRGAARSAAIHQAFGARRGVLAYSALYSRVITETAGTVQALDETFVNGRQVNKQSGAKRDEIH